MSNAVKPLLFSMFISNGNFVNHLTLCKIYVGMHDHRHPSKCIIAEYIALPLPLPKKEKPNAKTNLKMDEKKSRCHKQKQMSVFACS
jgi:hypothetical protein